MTVEPSVVADSIMGRRVDGACVVTRTPIVYDPFLPGRSVERVSGVAELNSDSVTWSAVVKRTERVGLRAARREARAYLDGVAQAGPGHGLVAPNLLAHEAGNDHVELWLEDLSDSYDGRWPTGRYGVAAQHIGEWDARMSTARPVPGFDSEDAWAERHGQPHRRDEAVDELRSLRNAPGVEGVMMLLNDDGFRRTESLIAGTNHRIERLATFPRTLLHHDLVRSNLFALTPSATAAIDWENVGRAPFGVDLAPLVCGSVRRGEASADDLPALEDTVLTGYESALREAGVDVADVRPAYALALALRWHVVLGSIRTWLDPTTTRLRGSRPDESRSEGLRHLISLSRHLLEAGDATS